MTRTELPGRDLDPPIYKRTIPHVASYVDFRGWLTEEARNYGTIVEPICVTTSMLSAWSGSGRLVLRGESRVFPLVVSWLQGDVDSRAETMASGKNFRLRGYMEDAVIRMQLGDMVVSKCMLDQITDDLSWAEELWRRMLRAARERILRAEIAYGGDLWACLMEHDGPDTLFYMDPFFGGRRLPDSQSAQYPTVVQFLKQKKGRAIVRELDNAFREHFPVRPKQFGIIRALYL